MSDQQTDPKLRGALLQLVFGYMGSQVIHVGARLGIPDLLAGGPRTSEDLAEAAEAHPASLHRLLRALACLGIVEETGETNAGSFRLTALGSLLRSDHPDSVRNLTLLFCDDRVWENWGHLTDSVRTGRPFYEQRGDRDAFARMADDSEFSAIFNEAMSEGTRQAAPGAIAAYDFSQFQTVIDVGGGDGTLLTAIVASTPGLRGILFDLPSGLGQATERLQAAGVADRCHVVAGDFFESVPQGGDAYLMKSVIHDWDDDRAITILQNCRRAMPPDGKLIILEPVLPPRIDRSPEMLGAVIVGDLNMLVSTGGRERTEAEFAGLLSAANLRLNNVIPLPPPTNLSALEGVPV